MSIALPVWTPTERQITEARVSAFVQNLALNGHAFKDYDELWHWSVSEPSAFWDALWHFVGVVGDRGTGPALTGGPSIHEATWFPDARLNFAENLIRLDGNGAAIVAYDEAHERRVITWEQLRRQVARVAAGLRSAGVVTGDRVAGFMPNVPETIIAMLATSSIGAVWTSCSPDFGVQGVLDRFGQVAPKVLFGVEECMYGGKRIDCRSKLARVVEGLPSLAAVVLTGCASSDALPIDNEQRFDTFGCDSAQLAFTRLPFDHPLYVLYSSGTTGVPKCIVHGAGGTLLQHLKEHQLHTDLRAGDRLFFYTTCGWMMWNWLASALASGVTIVLYEGSPLHPDPGVLWRIAERERIAVFGTSPKYLAALDKSGLRPRHLHMLDSLRTILSTGSPLAPEQYDFVRHAIGANVQLSSISGGTDIVSCFVLGSPLLAVHRGEIQCRGLGMKVEVWDDDGRPVIGEKGELVCTEPFPSRPIGFWGDADGTKYRSAYFERFPGVWHHGDYAELTERGGLVIHGRSDAVLNPGGVRIGTAEIYRQVEKLAEVLDCVAIGQDWQGDVRVVLFVRLQDGVQLDEDLRDRIARQIRSHTTPRHVPARIVQVTEVPRTVSGKVVELAVRNVVHGRPVTNSEALANPGCLNEFQDRSELAD